MKHLKHLLLGGALVASAVAVAQPAPPQGGVPGANGQPGKPAEMNRSQPNPNPGPAVRPNGGAPRVQPAPKPAPRVEPRPAPAPKPAPHARPAPVPPPKPRPQTPPPPPPKKGGLLHWLFG